MDTKTEVEKDAVVNGTTTFGLQGLQNPTPKWATIIFRTEFVANKVLLFWLGATHLVPNASLPEIILALSVIDMGVWTAARFVGVKKSDFES